MNYNKSSSIKKEIFFPAIIGDWTTYTSEKNKKSISITKSVGLSNKTISEQHLEELLFFHQEFFERFFENVASEINSHIDIETVSINILNHYLFKQSLKEDIYQCKYRINELEQVDLVLSKKATKFIAHRLCGGNKAPEEDMDPTELEISLVNVLNEHFINLLSDHWKKIFTKPNMNSETSYGHYHFDPQQSETETILELNCNFKLFNQHDLSCKVLYSLETIEKLIFLDDMLNKKIIENTFLTDDTLKNTAVDVRSTIGTTSLALSEIQNIEIGDVIHLEDHPLTAPVEVIIDESVVFHGHPISVNDRTIGVQITNSPTYHSVLKNLEKPIEGPLIQSTAPITTENDQVSTIPSIDMENEINITDKTYENTANTEPNIPTEPVIEPEPIEEPDVPSMEVPQPDMVLDPPINDLDIAPESVADSEPIPEESAPNEVANDDFSWDDLDDE